MNAIARISDHVPAGVELGLHFCYGDPGHKHIVEPKDTALMVDLANRLSKAIQRSITWLHMPVPRGRDDDADSAPLRNLKLKPGTEFYLGLVHRTDGIEGSERPPARGEKAGCFRFWSCDGMRLGPGACPRYPGLLALHREIAQLD